MRWDGEEMTCGWGCDELLVIGIIVNVLKCLTESLCNVSPRRRIIFGALSKTKKQKNQEKQLIRQFKTGLIEGRVTIVLLLRASEVGQP